MSLRLRHIGGYSEEHAADVDVKVDNGRDPMTLLDDEYNMSLDDGTIGMRWFRMDFTFKSRAQAALDNSLVERGVSVRLRMGWCGGLITCQSRADNRCARLRLHLEETKACVV